MSETEDEVKKKAHAQLATKRCCGQPMVMKPITPVLYLGKAITQAMVCEICKQGFHVMIEYESDPGEGMVGNA